MLVNGLVTIAVHREPQPASEVRVLCGGYSPNWYSVLVVAMAAAGCAGRGGAAEWRVSGAERCARGGGRRASPPPSARRSPHTTPAAPGDHGSPPADNTSPQTAVSRRLICLIYNLFFLPQN